MIQMFAEIPISVTPGRDVEITLDLVALQAAVNPTRIDLVAASQSRSLGELLTRVFPHFAENVVNVGVSLPRRDSVGVFLAEGLIFMGAAMGLAVALLHPELPAGAFALEQLSGEDTVARSVLDVDIEGVTGHVNDDIEVKLQVVADALLDAEVVVLGSSEPGAEFRERKNGADEEDENGPLPSTAGWGSV